jgi:nucleotide-binding universal stress UspA family protein
MKPIVLASDGSPASAPAMREAVALAAELHATLVAVCVEHVAVPAYGYYGYSEVYLELHRSEREHAECVLEEVAAAAALAGVDCETVALEGAVVDEICRFASERDAAMLVLGAHGWGTLRRIVFGSVSQGVLHEAPCPVLIARGPDQTDADATDAVETDRRVTAPA